MMMSPEAYYESELKGKTKEQILSVIRSLKYQIGSLKNCLEAPDSDEYEHSTPDEKTQIYAFREYLECAKKEYARLGGEYKLSKAEKEVLEFERRFPEISRLSLLIGGFFAGTEIIEATVTDKEVTIQSNLHMPGTDFEEDLSAPTLRLPKNEFFAQLGELHLGEWRSYYSTSRFGYRVMDGTQWELSVGYGSDPRDRITFHGDNSFPYNFRELVCLMRGEEEDSDDEGSDVIILTGEQEMIMNKLADYVAGLPEGTSITTTEAMEQVFPDFDICVGDYCGIPLFEIHVVLFEKLRDCGIEPDMSSHDGQPEGLPYNLDFTIRHVS